MKPARTRSKPCARCSARPTALYRAVVEREGPWVFLCEACLLAAKRENPSYRYGGTWKAHKRH